MLLFKNVPEEVANKIQEVTESLARFEQMLKLN